jgi:hypothetical protein
MTQDEQDILAEAEQIINGASKRINSDRAEGVSTEFKDLESAMWSQLGEPGGMHGLYAITEVASEDIAETMKSVADEPNRLIRGQGTVDGQEPDALIGLQLVAEGGDIYEMLGHQHLSLSMAREKSIVGVLARMDANATNAETEEKNDACITVMLLADKAYVAVRQYGKEGEPVFHTQIHSDDYEQGENRLIDAMLVFFALPKQMYEKKPRVMEALYKDLSAKAEGNKKQQQQQSKEDKQ